MYKRRDFLGDLVKAGTAGLLVVPALPNLALAKSLTVTEVIDLILKEVPGGRLSSTVDTIKSGRGDQLVTGIVTTMFATVKVIEEAVKLKANFIIAHEPTFYNHTDDINWVPNNGVVKQKQELLAKHQIAVWRFHDHWHRMRPDGILHGVLLKTGWISYSPNDDVNFQIPTLSLSGVVGHLKKTLGIPHLRVVGDLSSPCSRVTLLPGAAGGQLQVGLAEISKTDLLIVGECSEWETPEYIRDARSFGKPISLIVLGHAFSEEPGMEWLVQWLQPKVPEMKITHVASGEAFVWV
ncbi:MAG: Nif3-like dinuclear metal center hexameric protein [Chitinophagales bacterium]